MATEIRLETGGSVWKLLVKEGDQVEAGQTLFIMEVMKMEVPYDAPEAGSVSGLAIAEGDVQADGMGAAEALLVLDKTVWPRWAIALIMSARTGPGSVGPRYPTIPHIRLYPELRPGRAWGRHRRFHRTARRSGRLRSECQTRRPPSHALPLP